MNPKIKKFFYGKQTRYTIYKHIKEYLESKLPNAVFTFFVNCHDSHLYLDGVEV